MNRTAGAPCPGEGKRLRAGRVLAILLCAALLLGAIPTAAFIGSNEAAISSDAAVPGTDEPSPPSARADEPVARLLSDDVNQGIVCRLTPKKTAYSTGEMIHFNFDTQFADPGGQVAPPAVKFGIPLPTTTPALSLPMFNSLGTEPGYEGVPMCTLSFQGASTNLYLVTLGNGSRRIEYTIYPGDTIHGTLSMYLPNGVAEPISAFTLTPEILTAGDFSGAQLSGGQTSVQAQFGWNNVIKTGSTDNLGVIGAVTKDPDSITYTVTADSLSSGISTGRIFTGQYTLTDTISMTGLHYADGALTSSESGGVSSFFVGGVKVLEIPEPLSSLQVSKRAAGGELDGLTVVYSKVNPALGGTTPAEIPNLNLQIKLLLGGMALNSGNVDTALLNSAHFEAYSLFYDAAAGKTDIAYYHSSTASHTAHTTDRYELSKTAYMDAACTIPATTAISNGDALYYKLVAGNERANGGTFTIEDVLPNGLTYVATLSGGDGATFTKSGQTLTWSGVTIPSGGTHTLILQTSFSVSAITSAAALHNVANLYTGGKLVATDSADNVFISGETQDAEISYEKTANAAAPALDGNLTYTITVKNANRTTPKLITVTDKWPGTAIMPTAVTGCESFKLLDAGGTEYTLAQVAADPTIVITQIKCYNVFVPAGGRTTLTVTGKITQVLDELVNVVGEGSGGAASAKTYGVSITKAAHRYDPAAQAISDGALTPQDEIVAEDVVCYVMTVKNLKTSAVTATLVDKLPAGLTLESVTYQGVGGSVLIRRGNVFTDLGATGDADNVQTTTPFALDSGETVRVYLFARVSQAAITASESNGKKIVNAAYVRFESVQTGDATANIYTMLDNTQTISLDKRVVLIADYDRNLQYAGTKLTTYAGEDYNPNRENANPYPFWKGAYVVYRMQIKNCAAPRVGLYELIDTLPEGVDFVGVGRSGDRNFYYRLARAKGELTGSFYRDGESGPWESWGITYANNTKITCTYDPATRQVHILFNDGDESNPLLLRPGAAGTVGDDVKAYFHIIARVREDATASSFTNLAELRVNKSVNKLDNTMSERTDGNYKYLGASITNPTVTMRPGITKATVGHYAPSGPFIAGTENIAPGETLRFTVQLKNEDNSTNCIEADANAGNLRDFSVVDYLPPEYVYKAGSTSIGLNAKYNKGTGAQSSIPLSVVSLEPTVTPQDDGRTELTWRFTGKDTRLFNAYHTATEGYMHLLAYDADWNNDYPKVYGNYTNTATVIHSYDFRSVSTGSPDLATKSITASTVVNVYGAAGTVAEKKVTNAAGTTVSGQDTVNTVPITASETVRYTLSVQNAATTDTTYAKNLVIIDELPRAAGDTGVVNRVGRDSEFAVLFGGAPNVIVKLKDALNNETPVDPPGNYTVRYGMSVGGLNTNGDWSQAETGGRIAWGRDSNNKNAIRIAFAEDFHVPKGDTVIVSFSAVAASDAKPSETAWNSFGYSYRAVTGDETTAKIYAEPRRVGIQAPEATLSVTKALTGDPAPARAEFTFALKQNGAALPNVRYTLSGLDATLYTLADGTFKLKSGQTATLHVSPGSGFTVEEAISAAFMPAHFDFVRAAAAQTGDGTAAAQVFTYKTVDAGDAPGAVFTNSYTAPPVIDLTVEKQWAGDADPNRPTSVSVQLLGNGTPAGEPVTLNAGNGWAHTWTGLDNRATTWTVEETSTLPEGYTAQIAGDNTNGFVITNTYTRPEGRLTVHKTVTGGGNVNTLFTFRFTFSEAARYVCVFSSGGTGTIATGESLRLKRDESVSIILPRGITYTVVEDVYSDYIPTPSDRTFTGTVGVTQSRADYSNRYYTPDPYDPDPYDPRPNPEPYIPVPMGSLQVQKAITGDRADKAARFPFTVTFSAPGSYAYAGSQSGVLRSGDAVYLGNGDYINIFNLPAGTTYSVTESGNSGYMAYASGATGVVPANGVATAAFTNTRSSVPKTGDDNALLMGLLLMLVSAMGMLLMLLGMMRVRKKESKAK